MGQLEDDAIGVAGASALGRAVEIAVFIEGRRRPGGSVAVFTILFRAETVKDGLLPAFGCRRQHVGYTALVNAVVARGPVKPARMVDDHTGKVGIGSVLADVIAVAEAVKHGRAPI